MSNNILKITFTASTINGIILRNYTYTPAMSNPVVYKTFPNILFIPTIKLESNMFDEYRGKDDIKKIFLSPTQFDIFLSNLRNNQMYRAITISEAKNKGIIYHNIMFILNLFFYKGARFFINQHSFVINNYKWDNKYNLINISGQKAPIVDINLEFILHEGKELSFIDSTRLNCQQKRNDIIHDYYQLVGLEPPIPKMAIQQYMPTDSIGLTKNKTNNI